MGETTSSRTLFERVERLERENRRWRRGFTLAMSGALLCVLGGAQQSGTPKIVEAERFVLRDPQGRKRVELYEENGQIWQTFLDEDGSKAMSLGMNNHIPGLFIHPNDSLGGLNLFVAPQDSTARMSFSNREGKERMRFGVRGDGSPYMYYWSGGTTQLRLQLDKDGSPVMEDRDGKSLLSPPRQ